VFPDPALQNISYEQAQRALLASFTAGLTGTHGRQVRFSMSGTVEDALQIAITVAQAEIQERRIESFYLDSATP
jgi:hypothetical protein